MGLTPIKARHAPARVHANIHTHVSPSRICTPTSMYPHIHTTMADKDHECSQTHTCTNRHMGSTLTSAHGFPGGGS